MTQGSRKGGAFERRCAKSLSLWLTHGEDKGQLIRSVSSGGWKYRRVRQVGDLAPNGPAGEEFRLVYGVECKNRQSFRWQHLWTSGDPPLIQWWRKHAGECADAGLVPVMFYKRNYQPLLLVYPYGLGGSRWPVWDVQVDVAFGPLRLTFVEWEHFTANVAPEHFLDEGRAWTA